MATSAGMLALLSQLVLAAANARTARVAAPITAAAISAASSRAAPPMADRAVAARRRNWVTHHLDAREGMVHFTAGSFESADELRSTLISYGVDVGLWGTGGART